MNSIAQTKIGRNAPCPCGSGKKYKTCCAQAEARFRTRQAPNIDAMLTRARQAVREGDFESAEFFFRQVLAVNSAQAEALAGVGQGLCWRRKRREGKAFLVQAARQLEKDALKTRDTRLLTDLSTQLQHWGEMDAALRLARLAVRLAPHSAVTQNNLALCLSRVNRVEEALPAIANACELLTGEPGCLIMRAILDFRLGQTEQARRQLEQVIADDRVAVQTARAWLELGNVLDKAGEYDRAFAAFMEAAKRQAGLPEARQFDPDYIFRTLAHNRASFDGDLLNRWTGDIFDDGLPAPAFLFGFLRSGTTLTEQVLAAHPDVITSDENDFIFELTRELARLTGIRDDEAAALRRIDPSQARQLRRYYWERVREEYGPEATKQRFVDKLSLNSINAGLIATLFPEAKILFAVRDPCD
ncbi:MAG: hypothetical protein H6R26_3342, partial [Proteobacteria bacterium]|nr:hypothetical protein [Pseudomonadota bacterium]